MQGVGTDAIEDPAQRTASPHEAGDRWSRRQWHAVHLDRGVEPGVDGRVERIDEVHLVPVSHEPAEPAPGVDAVRVRDEREAQAPIEAGWHGPEYDRCGPRTAVNPVSFGA